MFVLFVCYSNRVCLLESFYLFVWAPTTAPKKVPPSFSFDTCQESGSGFWLDSKPPPKSSATPALEIPFDVVIRKT